MNNPEAQRRGQMLAITAGDFLRLCLWLTTKEKIHATATQFITFILNLSGSQDAWIPGLSPKNSMNY
jgi:hypothetical protein